MTESEEKSDCVRVLARLASEARRRQQCCAWKDRMAWRVRSGFWPKDLKLWERQEQKENVCWKQPQQWDAFSKAFSAGTGICFVKIASDDCTPNEKVSACGDFQGCRERWLWQKGWGVQTLSPVPCAKCFARPVHCMNACARELTSPSQSLSYHLWEDKSTCSPWNHNDNWERGREQEGRNRRSKPWVQNS